MKITAATIILASVSLLAIYISYLRIKSDTIGIRSAVVWVLLWISIGFFSIFPGLLDAAMSIVQMESRMFFILIFSVFILFALLFNLSSRVDAMQRNIAKLIQEIALLNSQLKKDKKE